jgi:RHS repeat-associated protein
MELQVGSREALYQIMMARYYSSSIGRFMAVDPAAKSAKAERPQSWNRYTYVSNNPLTYFDPDGREQTVRVGDKYYMGGNDGIPAPTGPIVGKGGVALIDKTVPMGNGNSMRVQVLYAEGESTAGGKLTGGAGVLKATINTGQGGDTTGKVEIKVFTADATFIAGSDGAKADGRASIVEVGSDLRTPDPDGQVCSFGGQVTIAGAGIGGGLDRTEGVEVSGETVPGIGGGIHGGPVKTGRPVKLEVKK